MKTHKKIPMTPNNEFEIFIRGNCYSGNYYIDHAKLIITECVKTSEDDSHRYATPEETQEVHRKLSEEKSDEIDEAQDNLDYDIRYSNGERHWESRNGK